MWQLQFVILTTCNDPRLELIYSKSKTLRGTESTESKQKAAGGLSLQPTIQEKYCMFGEAVASGLTGYCLETNKYFLANNSKLCSICTFLCQGPALRGRFRCPPRLGSVSTSLPFISRSVGHWLYLSLHSLQNSLQATLND